MEEIINKWIVEHLGFYIFLCVIFVIGIIFVTIWCCRIYYKVKKIDTLPCDKHSKDIADIRTHLLNKDELPCDNHKSRILNHDKMLVEVRTSIEFLTKNVDSLSQEFHNTTMRGKPFTQNDSPLHITDEGKKMIERLGINKMFERNWPRIKNLIDTDVQDKNAYDIDRFCLEQAIVFPEKFLNAKEILILKNDAYKQGLTLTSYMRVIAVLSRDEYFKDEGISI